MTSSIDENRLFDIAIVGGGISGLGLAAEAAQWGFDVILFEYRKLCSQTSGNSLRIIHGGLRYLQQFNIARVAESVRCQHELMKGTPQFVTPLYCLTPLARTGLKSRIPMRIAAGFYNLIHFGLTGSGAETTLISSAEAERQAPLLRGAVDSGALQWRDALLTEPAHLTRWLAEFSRQHGASIYEDSEVRVIARKGTGFTCECVTPAGPRSFRSRVVVNAAGPWLEQVRATLKPLIKTERLRWCKAFNIILNRRIIEKVAIGCEAKNERGVKRLYFITPRGSASVIGTGYAPFEGDPSEIKITAAEQNDFISTVNHAFPAVNISLSDVAAIEAGVLPLSPRAGDSLELLGSEKVHDHDGYIEIISTKYTTFKSQARMTLRKASRYLPQQY